MKLDMVNQMCIIRFFNIYYNVGTAYDFNGANTGNLPSGLYLHRQKIQGLNGKQQKRLT
jgi:hypothetical protein